MWSESCGQGGLATPRAGLLSWVFPITTTSLSGPKANTSTRIISKNNSSIIADQNNVRFRPDDTGNTLATSRYLETYTNYAASAGE